MEFKQDLQRGQVGENLLDKHFSNRYRIEPVDIQTEIDFGYDRLYYRDDRTIRVEYKTDFLTMKTGNVFLETEVLTYASQKKKLGWVLHSQADIIIYYSEPVILIMRQSELKKFVSENRDKFLTRTKKNVVNEATGILVPWFLLFNNKTITIRSETICLN